MCVWKTIGWKCVWVCVSVCECVPCSKSVPFLFFWLVRFFCSPFWSNSTGLALYSRPPVLTLELFISPLTSPFPTLLTQPASFLLLFSTPPRGLKSREFTCTEHCQCLVLFSFLSSFLLSFVISPSLALFIIRLIFIYISRLRILLIFSAIELNQQNIADLVSLAFSFFSVLPPSTCWSGSDLLRFAFLLQVTAFWEALKITFSFFSVFLCPYLSLLSVKVPKIDLQINHTKSIHRCPYCPFQRTDDQLGWSDDATTVTVSVIWPAKNTTPVLQPTPHVPPPSSFWMAKLVCSATIPKIRRQTDCRCCFARTWILESFFVLLHETRISSLLLLGQAWMYTHALPTWTKSFLKKHCDSNSVDPSIERFIDL